MRDIRWERIGISMICCISLLLSASTSFPMRLEGKLAFTRRVGDTEQICVMDWSGTRIIYKSTFNPGEGIGSLSWSPDGEYIAFDVITKGATKIFIISSRGGTPRELRIEKEGYEFKSFYNPDWSPKGDEIAFVGVFKVKGGARREIFTVKAEGGEAKEITHDRVTPGIGYLSWAPDGRRIAFDRGSWEEWNQDLFIVDTISGHVERLTQTKNISEQKPSFSPDGRRIAYVTQDLPDKIFILDLETGVHNEISLPSDVDVRNSTITWSGDGSRIIFDSRDLYLYDLKAGSLRSVVRSSAIERNPDWWTGYTPVRPLDLLPTLWPLIKMPLER